MAFQWPSKSAADLLDYGINWSQFLGTDTITASGWQISPGGLVDSRDSFTPQIATVWLSSGTPGQTYSVTNTITTAAGRVVDQTVNITITRD